jgi:hypothetical protein
MDKHIVEALGEYLGRFITFSEGPRVGRILPQVFRSEGCDHSLTRTIEWMKAEGRDVDAEVRWLKQRGGTCDCRVVQNVIWRLDDDLEY